MTRADGQETATVLLADRGECEATQAQGPGAGSARATARGLPARQGVYGG